MKQPVHIARVLTDQRLCQSLVDSDLVHTGAVIGLTQADESLVRAHADQHPWEGLQNDSADVRDLHWSLRYSRAA